MGFLGAYHSSRINLYLPTGFSVCPASRNTTTLGLWKLGCLSPSSPKRRCSPRRIPADSMPVSFLLPFRVGLVLQPNQFHTTLHNQFLKLHDVPSCPGFFPSFPRLLCRWRHLPRLPREFLQGPQGLLPRPLAASHGNPNEMGHGFHGDVKLPEGM